MKKTNFDLAVRAHKIMHKDTILLSKSPQEFFWEEGLGDEQKRESAFRKFYNLPKVLPQYVGSLNTDLDNELKQYKNAIKIFRKYPTEESCGIARALFVIIVYAASTNYVFSA